MSMAFGKATEQLALYIDASYKSNTLARKSHWNHRPLGANKLSGFQVGGVGGILYTQCIHNPLIIKEIAGGGMSKWSFYPAGFTVGLH